MKTKDMSVGQYHSALDRYGFKPCGFLGYYRMPPPHESQSVSVLNAGDRRRDRLAYLLKCLAERENNAKA